MGTSRSNRRLEASALSIAARFSARVRSIFCSNSSDVIESPLLTDKSILPKVAQVFNQCFRSPKTVSQNHNLLVTGQSVPAPEIDSVLGDPERCLRDLKWPRPPQPFAVLHPHPNRQDDEAAAEGQHARGRHKQ